MTKFSITALLLLPAAASLAAPTGGSTCDSLSKLSLPNVTITSAQSVAAGAFTPPATPGPFGPNTALFKGLPAFCRVMATLTPSIRFRHQGRSLASGLGLEQRSSGHRQWRLERNHGLCCAGRRREARIRHRRHRHRPRRRQRELRAGASGKADDFAYRAVHEMTVTSKAIIQDFYGSAPRYSYWNGCSTGGRQGLKEAQKFPADFDGIVAGAPANYQTHLHVWSVWLAQQVNKTPDSFLPPDEARRRCTKPCSPPAMPRDGVKDGLMNDPTRCHFDPKTIECKGEDLPTA